MTNAQVGVGEVPIVPTLRGFRRAVSNEVDSSARTASSSFRSALAGTGSQAGAASGKGFRGAFEQQSVGFSSAASRELEQSVARSSRAVSSARLKEQDAAGKVRVAEAQLAEARSKYASDSSQVVRAEERLATATRQLGQAQDTTRSATDDLRSAQGRLASAADSAGEQIGQSGRRGATRFVSGFRDVLAGSFVGTALANVATRLASSVQEAISEGVRAAWDYLGESVAAASSLQQSIGAVEAVFKSNSATIEEWAAGAAKSVGLSKDSYNQFASLVGAQLKNFGFDLSSATDLTGKLIGLGADLASQYGGPTSDAVGAISSLLRGERDPIERYAVTINEAAVQAEALSLGLATVTQNADKVQAAQNRAEVAQRKYNDAVDSFGSDSSQALTAQASLISANSALESAMAGNTAELTAQQKAQATLSLLWKQTADSQGNFAREQDTLAGKQATLTAQWENAQTALGTALIPAMTALTEVASEQLIPVLNDVISRVGPQLGQALTDAVPSIVDFVNALVPMIPKLVDLGTEALPLVIKSAELLIPLLTLLVDHFSYWAGAANNLFDLLSGDTSTQQFIDKSLQMGGVLGWVTNMIRDSFAAARDFGAMLGGFTADAVQALGQKTVEVVAFVASLPQRAVDALGDLGRTLFGSGRALISGFVDGIRSRIDDAGSAVSGVMEHIAGFFPHSPALRGPFSGSGWTALPKSGSALLEQFASGMRGWDGAQTVGVALAAAVPTAVPASGTGVGGRAQAATGADLRPISQTNYFDKTDPHVAAQLANQQLNGMIRGA